MRAARAVIGAVAGAMVWAGPAHGQGVAGGLAGGVAASPGTTAFVGVTVVPMDGERLLRDHTVVVRNGRIEAVGPADRVAVPADAARIEGRGRWLMPGLAEMHAHVPPANATEQGLKDLMFLYVANGVTTIRGMLGAPYQLELRSRLQRGEVLGPTFYASAPSLNGQSAPTADSAASLVRRYAAEGYDLLKIHPGLTREAYDGIARTGREVGITWAGHVPQAVGLEHALTSGQSTIDHLDGYLQAAIPEAAAQRLEADDADFGDFVRAIDAARFPALARETAERGTWNVPTVLLWENLYGAEHTPESLAARPEMVYAGTAAVQQWIEGKRNRSRMDAENGLTPELSREFLRLRREMLKALADAGAPILMGTDSPQLFMVPGFSIHRELEIMAAAGLTPYQIYETGSRNVARYAAEALGDDGRFGTVAVGNRADLVLLEANPLDSVANLKRRAGVMVGGRWVPEAEIRAGLEELAARLR